MSEGTSLIAGYAYLLTNPYMPGLVKTGRTSDFPTRRLAELSRSTGVPGNFELRAFVHVDNETICETTLHRIYKDARCERGEFFKISLAAAIEALGLIGPIQFAAEPLIPPSPASSMPAAITVPVPLAPRLSFKDRLREIGRAITHVDFALYWLPSFALVLNMRGLQI